MSMHQQPAMNDKLDRLFSTHLKRADAAGIHPPVIALLDPNSKPAAAAYVDEYRQPIQARGPNYLKGDGLMVTWSVPVAARLLRRHCGLGGSAASNRLEDWQQELGYWIVMLREDRLTLRAFNEDGPSFSCSVFYNQLPYKLCECCAHDEDELCGSVRFKGGKVVYVYGRTHADWAKVHCLVVVVAGRRLPSLRRENRKVDQGLPVKDAELAMMLRDFYSDTPKLVADTIRALRRAKIKDHLWLTQTLDAHPELQSLAALVRKELARRTSD